MIVEAGTHSAVFEEYEALSDALKERFRHAVLRDMGLKGQDPLRRVAGVLRTWRLWALKHGVVWFAPTAGSVAIFMTEAQARGPTAPRGLHRSLALV